MASWIDTRESISHGILQYINADVSIQELSQLWSAVWSLIAGLSQKKEKQMLTFRKAVDFICSCRS